MNDPAALPERLAKAALSSDLIRRADQIAEAAHAGQFRKDEETPYIDHPRCVAEWFLDYAERRQLSPEDIDQGVCAALLHDVVEDTQTTAADLKQAFPHPRMLELIALLTKSDTTTSAPARYYEQIAGDPSAVVLKTCDRIANLYDAAALPDTLENRAFWRKYARKSEAFVERLVRSDTILGGELSRALYVVRTRIALTDPWCLLVGSGGFLGVNFYLINNTDAPLESVRSKAEGWMTLDDNLVQTAPKYEQLGDVPPHDSKEIGMDEPGGYIRYDLEFHHAGSDVEVSFAVDPDQWYFPRCDVGRLCGIVLPARNSA